MFLSVVRLISYYSYGFTSRTVIVRDSYFTSIHLSYTLSTNRNSHELKAAERKYMMHRVRALEGIEDTKLEAHNFPDKLSERGTDFFAGVSDSLLLKDACACISDTVPGDSGHVPTANEGTAVAAATGHHVATGKTSMVCCLPRVKVLYLP